MPGYRRIRYVDRPTYYTNSAEFKAPVYIADISIYFYKVSEVVAAIAPAPFGADNKQWYLNDTGSAINYTNNSGSPVNLFIYTSNNNYLFMDRLAATKTKSIPNAAYFVVYISTSTWMPIIDATATRIFSIYEGDTEPNSPNNSATVFNGSYYLALQYKLFVPSTPSSSNEELRSRALTGFEILALNSTDIPEENDCTVNNSNNTQIDEPSSKREN